MIRQITFIIFTILVNASAASAKDVKVGSTSINLTTPSGFCVLDEDSDRVKSLRDLLVAQNQLLAFYADCRSNLALSLDNFANYIAPINAINVSLPADTIKQVCAAMRARGDEKLATIFRERALDIEKAFEGIKITELRFIGVVAEDPAVCYTAQIQKVATGTGTEKILVDISAAMKIRGKFIVYNLYSPYVNNDTVATMLDRHRSNVSAFFAANRN